MVDLLCVRLTHANDTTTVYIRVHDRLVDSKPMTPKNTLLAQAFAAPVNHNFIYGCQLHVNRPQVNESA